MFKLFPVLPENFIEMEHNDKSAEIKRLQEILANMKQKVQVQNWEREYFEDNLKKSYWKTMANMSEEIDYTEKRNLKKMQEFKDKHAISLEQGKINIRNNALKTNRIYFENLEKTANERMKQILQEWQNAVDILNRKNSEVESLQKQFYNLDVPVGNQECDLTDTEMTEEINDLKQQLKQLVEANIAVQNEWSSNAPNLNGRKNEIAHTLENTYQSYKKDQTSLFRYKIVWEKSINRLSELTHK